LIGGLDLNTELIIILVDVYFTILEEKNQTPDVKIVETR
jgi:hypothetical protein